MNKMSISETESQIEALSKSLKNKKYYQEHRLEILARKRAKRLEANLKKENPDGLTDVQKREIKNAKQRAYRSKPEVKKKHNDWNRAYNDRPEVLKRRMEQKEQMKFKGLARQATFFKA